MSVASCIFYISYISCCIQTCPTSKAHQVGVEYCSYCFCAAKKQIWSIDLVLAANCTFNCPATVQSKSKCHLHCAHCARLDGLLSPLAISDTWTLNGMLNGMPFCDYPYIRKCREIARWSSLLGLRCSSTKECQREMASSSSVFGARQEKWLHETICSLTWTLKSIEKLDPMCLHSACPRITMQEYCNCSCIVWAWFCWATASFT